MLRQALLAASPCLEHYLEAFEHTAQDQPDERTGTASLDAAIVRGSDNTPIGTSAFTKRVGSARIFAHAELGYAIETGAAEATPRRVACDGLGRSAGVAAFILNQPEMFLASTR
jgi:hypothetical protein